MTKSDKAIWITSSLKSVEVAEVDPSPLLSTCTPNICDVVKFEWMSSFRYLRDNN